MLQLFYLLNTNNNRPVYPDKILRIEMLFKVFHGQLLQVFFITCVKHHIIILCFKIYNLVNGNNMNPVVRSDHNAFQYGILLDILEDNDDVQEVYDNSDIDETEMEALAEQMG